MSLIYKLNQSTEITVPVNGAFEIQAPWNPAIEGQYGPFAVQATARLVQNGTVFNNKTVSEDKLICGSKPAASLVVDFDCKSATINGFVETPMSLEYTYKVKTKGTVKEITIPGTFAISSKGSFSVNIADWIKLMDGVYGPHEATLNASLVFAGQAIASDTKSKNLTCGLPAATLAVGLSCNESFFSGYADAPMSLVYTTVNNGTPVNGTYEITKAGEYYFSLAWNPALDGFERPDGNDVSATAKVIYQGNTLASKSEMRSGLQCGSPTADDPYIVTQNFINIDINCQGANVAYGSTEPMDFFYQINGGSVKKLASFETEPLSVNEQWKPAIDGTYGPFNMSMKAWLEKDGVVMLEKYSENRVLTCGDAPPRLSLELGCAGATLKGFAPAQMPLNYQAAATLAGEKSVAAALNGQSSVQGEFSIQVPWNPSIQGVYGPFDLALNAALGNGNAALTVNDAATGVVCGEKPAVAACTGLSGPRDLEEGQNATFQISSQQANIFRLYDNESLIYEGKQPSFTYAPSLGEHKVKAFVSRDGNEWLSSAACEKELDVNENIPTDTADVFTSLTGQSGYTECDVLSSYYGSCDHESQQREIPKFQWGEGLVGANGVVRINLVYWNELENQGAELTGGELLDMRSFQVRGDGSVETMRFEVPGGAILLFQIADSQGRTMDLSNFVGVGYRADPQGKTLVRVYRTPGGIWYFDSEGEFDSVKSARVYHAAELMTQYMSREIGGTIRNNDVGRGLAISGRWGLWQIPDGEKYTKGPWDSQYMAAMCGAKIWYLKDTKPYFVRITGLNQFEDLRSDEEFLASLRSFPSRPNSPQTVDDHFQMLQEMKRPWYCQDINNTWKKPQVSNSAFGTYGGVKATVVPAASGKLGEWFALNSDRSGELQQCAQRYENKTVKFDDFHGWPSNASGVGNGHEVCQSLGYANCKEIMDWECGLLACSNSVETSRMVKCSN